jgi:hypothetical protein
MLDLVAEREPQVAQILTHNAGGNEHMIAINDELGFEMLERQPSWELAIAHVPARSALRRGAANS